jgi:hypothetical protein
VDTRTPEPVSFLSPSSFVDAARKAHPAFKYAVAVAGLLSIVATVSRYGVSSAALVLGTIVLVGLMVLFLVFAQAASLRRATLALPAQVLVWSFLILAVLSATMLVSSAFLDAPLPLRTAIVRQLSAQQHLAVPRSQEEPTQTPASAVIRPTWSDRLGDASEWPVTGCHCVLLGALPLPTTPYPAGSFLEARNTCATPVEMLVIKSLSPTTDGPKRFGIATVPRGSALKARLDSGFAFSFHVKSCAS